MESLRYRPVALWKLDDVALKDYSGYGNVLSTEILRTNYVPNPSFENDLSFWSNFNFQTTPSRVSPGSPGAQIRNGNWSYRVPASNNIGSGDIRPSLGISSTSLGQFIPGNTYTFSAWVHYERAHTNMNRNTTSRQRRLLLWWYYDGNTNANAVFGPQADNVTGWQRLTYTFTIPMNATGFQVAVGCAGSPEDAGLLQHVDSVQFEDGSTATDYFDGTMAYGTWAGAPHASATNYTGARTMGFTAHSKTTLSRRVGAEAALNSPNNVFKGAAKEEFSIEAALNFGHSLTTMTDAQRIWHNGNTGLKVTQNSLIFETENQAGAVHSAVYRFGSKRRMHITATHTENKNSIYVDGELVAEADAEGRLKPVDKFIMGGVQNAQTIGLNVLAMYRTALQPSQIHAIAKYATDVPDADPSLPYGGQAINFSTEDRVPASTFVWESMEDFTEMTDAVDIEFREDGIYPTFIDGLSIPATWEDSVDIGRDETEVINNTRIKFDGVGVRIYTSLDGNTWTEQFNDSRISNISNYTPGGKPIMLRAVFTEGLAEAYLKSVRIDTFVGNNLDVFGWTVSYDSLSIMQDSFRPFDTNDNWGVRGTRANAVVLNPGIIGRNFIANSAVTGNPPHNYAAQHGSVSLLGEVIDESGVVVATRNQDGVGENRLAALPISGMPLDASKNVYFKAYIRLPAARQVRLEVNYLRTDGSNAWAGFQTVNVAADTWTEFELNSPLPSTATSVLRVQFVVFNCDKGEVIQGRNFVLNNSPVEYFNGNQLGARWTGVLNNSTSELVSSSPTQIRTVEVWYRRYSDTPNGGSTNIFIGSNAEYTNGESGASSTPQNDWLIRHAVYPSGYNGNVLSLNNNIQLGRIAFYPTPLNQQQIKTIVDGYSCRSAITVNDASTISVSELAGSVNSYSHNWQKYN